MHSFEQLRLGDELEHEVLKGRFTVANVNPTVIMRVMKLVSLDGWYSQGARGVLMSLSKGDVKRGDILRSTSYQGEFTVTLVSEQYVFLTEMRLLVAPKGWWVVTPGQE